MHSPAVLAFTVVFTAGRTVGRAAVASVQALLVLAIWVALLATGVAMLCGKIGRTIRDAVAPAHFQIHW